MKCLIFTQSEYETVLSRQSGQHRLAPIALSNGKYFLMEDVLTEIPDGIYKDRLSGITYEVVEFDDIKDFVVPINTDNQMSEV